MRPGWTEDPLYVIYSGQASLQMIRSVVSPVAMIEKDVATMRGQKEIQLVKVKARQRERERARERARRNRYVYVD